MTTENNTDYIMSSLGIGQRMYLPSWKFLWALRITSTNDINAVGLYLLSLTSTTQLCCQPPVIVTVNGTITIAQCCWGNIKLFTWIMSLNLPKSCEVSRIITLYRWRNQDLDRCSMAWGHMAGRNGATLQVYDCLPQPRTYFHYLHNT